MKPKECIEISQVNNGYIVRQSHQRGDFADTWDHAKVFQSMEELQAFIFDHFDYRKSHLISDPT